MPSMMTELCSFPKNSVRFFKYFLNRITVSVTSRLFHNQTTSSDNYLNKNTNKNMEKYMIISKLSFLVLKITIKM